MPLVGCPRKKPVSVGFAVEAGDCQRVSRMHVIGMNAGLFRRRGEPWTGILIAATLLAASLVPAPARATDLQINSMFYATNQSVWAGGPGFSFDTGYQNIGTSWNYGKTIDATACLLGVCARGCF